MLRPLLLAALLASPFLAQAQLPQAPLPQVPLPQAVLDKLAAANITPEAMSVLVLRGDQALVSYQPERSMQPASTIKLVTTIVGLDQLGPAFRARTELRSNARVMGDMLLGDLVLRGGGDADLDTTALAGMLQALRNQGIRRIGGKLVLDRSLFNPARTDVGLPPFDESPDAYYNVIPDALLVNKNMLQLDIRSNEQGVQLVMQPELDRVKIESGMTLIAGECARWEDGWKQPEVIREASGTIRVVLRGTFPRNCVAANSINVVDRQDYVDRLLRLTWETMGGEIAGETVSGVTPADARLLASHQSRSLPEVVRDINKPSDNALARLVFLSLGSLEADPALGSKTLAPLGGMTAVPTTSQRAELAVRGWMRARGINDTGFVIDNGSGLSRTERISAVQMAGVLQGALRSKWAPEFQSSMPIAAVDGTMRRRLAGSPAAERARIKTGGLSNVVAVAGYVPDASGQLCVVVAMINVDQAGRGRPALDALIDWVARSPTPGA
jgi:D-alanyl-D-alanine carboxypeptidase/D-alanyl-D-alanine-endopeptidase (penicillin-binding protein 4)